MKMDRRIEQIALDVERSSRQGAQELQNGQLEKAISSFDFAYRQSRQLDEGHIERACAFNLGAAYIAAKQPKKGVEILQHAVPPPNQKDGRSNGDLYFNFGLGYEGVNDKEEAIRNFTMALDEYKLERDSSTLPSEAETLEKLCKLCVESNNIYAADNYDKLSALYELMNNPVKQLQTLCHKTTMLLKTGKKEETKEAAIECEKLLEVNKCRETTTAGNVFNELGLIYTELQMFDEAQRCFEAALPLVRSLNPIDKKQEAIVLQNLGASCNFVGDYQKAIQFHEESARCYAQLKNRNSQGQCFANLAFAYSQLGRLDLTKENFKHALLAAEDTDDKRSQWQVLEGLGAVAYNQNRIQEAVEFYKKALSAAASCDNISVIQGRLVEKLEFCLNAKVQSKSMIHSSPSVKSSTPPRNQVIKETAELSKSAPSGKVSSKRFVPVNRPGTSRQYHKVARGLSTLSGGTLTTTMDASETLRPGTMLEQDSSSTGSSSKSSSDDSDPEEFKKKVMSSSPMRQTTSVERSLQVTRHKDMRHDEPLLSGDSSSSDEESSESSKSDDEEEVDEDEEAVKQQMQKLQRVNESSSESSDSSDAESDDSEDSETQQKQTLTPVAEVKEKSPMVPSSSDSSDDEEEEEEDEEEEEEEEDKLPELPTSSPPPTSSMIMNTYEHARDRGKQPKELARQHSYKDIDFENKPKQGEGKFDGLQHPNFLSDESLESDVTQQILYDGEDLTKYENLTPKLRTYSKPNSVMNSDEDDPKDIKPADEEETKSETKENGKEEAEPPRDHIDEDDPVYQSINPKDMADIPSFEKTEGSSSFSDLPRGENKEKLDHQSTSDSASDSEGERFLHEKHKEIVQKRSENQEPEEQKSKTCVVM